jgi:hypothetical protein
MDFLLCCPRGPDHQGRHAVPEAESAEEGQEEEENRPRGCTGSAAKPQRIEKWDLRRQVREEMERSAIRSRRGGKARIIAASA